jgi:radical SAM protein with 4Fe4S-binding SPASM domain
LDKFPTVIKVGCSSCSFNHVCSGGCPAFIFDRYSNLLKKDPRCWIS